MTIYELNENVWEKHVGIEEKDCETMIERDYQQRLKEALPAMRPYIRRRTVQEIFDVWNYGTRNEYRRVHRYITARRDKDTNKEISDGIELVADPDQDLDACVWAATADCVALEAVLRKHLKEKDVDLVMQVYIWRSITIQELAAKEGIEANTMSKRARRALGKVKSLWDAGKLFTR